MSKESTNKDSWTKSKVLPLHHIPKTINSLLISEIPWILYKKLPLKLKNNKLSVSSKKIVSWNKRSMISHFDLKKHKLNWTSLSIQEITASQIINPWKRLVSNKSHNWCRSKREMHQKHVLRLRSWRKWRILMGNWKLT